MRTIFLATILTMGLLTAFTGTAAAQYRLSPHEEARRYEQTLRLQDRIQRGKYVPLRGPYAAPSYAIPVNRGRYMATPSGMYYDSYGPYGPGVRHPGFGYYLDSYGPAWNSPYAWGW